MSPSPAAACRWCSSPSPSIRISPSSKTSPIPCARRRSRRAEITKRVNETAAMLKLSHRLERKPNTLSGGEQQRVALGRSLVRHPKILLLDEPLTNLDAKLRHDMRAELKRLHRQFGMTIVYATPDELEALSMGEEIAVMRDGAVVQRGTPEELYERPVNTYVAGKIGSPHMNMLQAKVGKDAKTFETPLGKMSPQSAAQDGGGGRSGHHRHPPQRHQAGGQGRKSHRLENTSAGAARRHYDRLGGNRQAKCCAWCCPKPRQPRSRLAIRPHISLIQTIFTSSAPQVGR